MRVLLAGYNVDSDILGEIKEKSGYDKDNLTPETFSAAYARISRDPRPIDEIRQDAREEVERTRKSNKAIIFNLGHSSVAEHAVFNFDIVGLSRYAMEYLEKFRLASFTEKSQRYITLDGNFILPEDVREAGLESEFTAMISKQNALYDKLYDKLREHVFTKHEELAADPKKTSLLEGWAKEDARYVTALATGAQVGMTVNARTLELMLRRFASCPLAEIRELGRNLYDLVEKIAPSIIRYHEANPLDECTYPEIKALASEIVSAKADNADEAEVNLVSFDKDGDDLVGAALLHSSGLASMDECKKVFSSLDDDKKKDLFKASFKNLQLYNSVLREFEYASLLFEVNISAACFGQLKRHRMSSMTVQPYDPSLGIKIPDAIQEIGMQDEFMAVADESASLYSKIKGACPNSAEYILTNAHKRRVLIRTNLRELYHISRLREDAHAQWDIRNISRMMREEAEKVMPLACMLIGGKDVFADVYENVFGAVPTR